jgi:hypothetical protein
MGQAARRLVDPPAAIFFIGARLEGYSGRVGFAVCALQRFVAPFFRADDALARSLCWSQPPPVAERLLGLVRQERLC